MHAVLTQRIQIIFFGNRRYTRTILHAMLLFGTNLASDSVLLYVQVICHLSYG